MAPLAVLARWAAALLRPALSAPSKADFSPSAASLLAALIEALEQIASAVPDADPRSANHSQSRHRRLRRMWAVSIGSLIRSFVAAGSNAFLRLLPFVVAQDAPPSRRALVAGIAAAAIGPNTVPSAFNPFSAHVCDLIAKSVLPSKTSLPPAILETFAPAIQLAVTQESLMATILPPVDRLLLRSPEVVLATLNYCLRPLNFDLGQVLRDKFADALLNQLKSSSESVRSDALALFDTLARKTTSEDALVAVVGSISKAFTSKSPLPDQRVAFYEFFDRIPSLPLVSQAILATIPNLVAKESSDPAYTAALAAFGLHLSAVLTPQITPAEITDATMRAITFVIQGLADSKAYVRRAHLNAIMHVSSNPSASISVFGKSSTKLMDLLVAMSERVHSAGLALLDPKKDTPTLSEACIATTTLLRLTQNKQNMSSRSALIDRDYFARILSLNPSNAVLFGEKYYRKLLTSHDEQNAFADIVVTIIQDPTLFDLLVVSEDCRSTLAGALAWVFLCTLNNVQQRASQSISTCVSSSSDALSRMASLLRLGLCAFFVSSTGSSGAANGSVESLAWQDSPARSSALLGQRAYTALVSLLPQDASETLKPILEPILMDLAVTASLPPLVLARGSDVWVSLCFRCGLDPRDILDKHAPAYVSAWIKSSNTHISLGGLHSMIPVDLRIATLACLRLFAEIATRIVLKTALPHTLEIMADPAFDQVTHTDVLVWSTPSDELFDDPLRQRDKDDSSRPSSSEEKWERELKKELAAKRAAFKAAINTSKLSKADREARQQRFAEEAAIRARISDLKNKLDMTLDILTETIEGVRQTIGDEARDEFGIWVGRITNALLAIIRRECVPSDRRNGFGKRGVLAGTRAVDLYANLAQVIFMPVQDQVDDDAVAVGILRSIDVNPSAFSSGSFQKHAAAPFAKFVCDILESLAEEFPAGSPLDASALAFIFPLLHTIILRQGQVTQLKEKSRTLLIMAASDVLLAHCAVPGSPVLVPRQDIAVCLVHLLKDVPRLRTAARGGLLALVIAATAASDADDDDNDSDSNHDMDDAVKTLHDKNGLPGITHVLLEALLSGEEAVREAAISGLLHMPVNKDSINDVFETRVWLACSDAAEDVSAEASRLWEDMHDGTHVPIAQDKIPALVTYLEQASAPVRESAGRALYAALKTHSVAVQPTLELLYHLYAEKAADPVPEYDEYGMVIPESLNKPDEWETRTGIAHAIKSCVSIIQSEKAMRSLFAFLIDTEALGDKNSTVQQRMLDAGLAALNEHGKDHVRMLLDMFDCYLSRPAVASEAHDRIRESVVILLGSIAKHMESDDKRIPEVISKLIETLKTPSELVQAAVAECLPALIRSSKDEAPQLVELLVKDVLSAPKYGDRRGAAYGLAGVVKGYGITALKEFGIMATLKSAVEDKKNATAREGALFAYETLSYMLGRSFEPYVIQILPLLLVCFGDSNKQVRQATEDTCRVIMSKLSAHCVKLVLPSLLNGLHDKAWRAKTGSLDVMASMSALAPKQLSQSLPMIVPGICEALADSHQKVQEAARQALVQFGGVIKNPEIQELVPTLISALVDPNHQTETALAALLETTFVHYVDSPSLALLVPIIHRGLRERSAEIKKKAAQIMGNMSSLTEQTDLVPYLQNLMPSLKEVLIDPVPESRATAARAFGLMVEKLGEDNFPGLVAELLETLKSDTSTVDRSGAAQGLSEVLAGLGIQRLEGLLPEIVANTTSIRSYVREGFTTLLVYLPATFGERFTPYLPMIIPPILQGLADESDIVRNSALQSGQVIVRNYAHTAISLLLPELERGLFDVNWRIRHNSMLLLGDLLFRIAGVTSKIDVDEVGDHDEGLGTEHTRQVLKETLGQERYEKILASVYIIRNDSSAVVRQSSLQVWKAIVTNTPRTLKETLHEIMKILLASLASPNVEKRGVAARTLGDLVRRMGEAVLHDIIPILEIGLNREDADTREGVCVGMTEIMASASKTQIVDFVVYCTPLVKRALLDPSSDVREAAAQAFDVLHQHLGNKAIDDILPSLLADLKSDSTGVALEALKEIMTVRSNVVFPVLIPTLISKPITPSNARALASLISVAGHALNRRLGTILPALLEDLYGKGDKQASVDIEETLRVLMASVQGDDGVHGIMVYLTETLREGKSAMKRSACVALRLFFENAHESFESYIQDWIQVLVAHMAGDDGDGIISSMDVLSVAWQALDALVKRIKKDDLDKFVTVARRGIRDAELGLGASEEIPGFNLPKGVSPILPIFLQGLMYGSIETREQSAYGVGDLINHASEGAIKPFVTQITGPLIRVVGDRFPPNVKSAILQTLGLLLTRMPAMLKPFLPQLQRTFVKSLSDASGTAMMRDRAARCLSLLIPLQTRLDPLVAELVQGIRSNEDAGIKPAVWEALCGLLRGIGRGTGREISDASRKSIESLLTETLTQSLENQTTERIGAAKCFGAFCAYLPVADAKALLSKHILNVPSDAAWNHRQGIIMALRYTLEEARDVMDDTDMMSRAAQMLGVALVDDKSDISDHAVLASDRLLQNSSFSCTGAASELIQTLIQVTLPGMRSIETRRESIVALKNLAKTMHQSIEPHVSALVPALMTNVRDRAIPIKLAAERALVHVLEVRRGMRTLNTYLATLEGPAARSIGDYARRVLVKIGERDSDTEDIVFD